MTKLHPVLKRSMVEIHRLKEDGTWSPSAAGRCIHWLRWFVRKYADEITEDDFQQVVRLLRKHYIDIAEWRVHQLRALKDKAATSVWWFPDNDPQRKTILFKELTTERRYSTPKYGRGNSTVR